MLLQGTRRLAFCPLSDAAGGAPLSSGVKRQMKKLGFMLALFLLLFMALSIAGMWHLGSLRKRAVSLKAGDTKADVQRVLGRPVSVFVPAPGTNFVAWLLSVKSETWAYGSRYDLGALFHGESPLRLRLFRPESNDVAVVFNSSGRVAQVIIPGVAP